MSIPERVNRRGIPEYPNAYWAREQRMNLKGIGQRIGQPNAYRVRERRRRPTRR